MAYTAAKALPRSENAQSTACSTLPRRRPSRLRLVPSSTGTTQTRTSLRISASPAFGHPRYPSRVLPMRIVLTDNLALNSSATWMVTPSASRRRSGQRLARPDRNSLRHPCRYPVIRQVRQAVGKMPLRTEVRSRAWSRAASWGYDHARICVERDGADGAAFEKGATIKGNAALDSVELCECSWSRFEISWRYVLKFNGKAKRHCCYPSATKSRNNSASHKFI